MSIRPDTKAALLKAGRFYRNAAVFLLNTVVAFAAANVAVDVAYRTRAAFGDPPARLGPAVVRHGLDRIARAYPGLDRRDLVRLLEETMRVYENDYEPFVDFRPRSFAGRFVNVSKQGFRRVEPEGPWPPEPAAINVFVFGGSTTFGLGLADADSIPSRLAARLGGVQGGRPLRVYNLGRGGYVSAQERVLLESLLVSGVVPDLAVFIDGFNEFYVWPQPLAADVMRRALAAPAAEGGRFGSLVAGLPLGRLALALRRRVAPPLAPEPPAPEPPSAEAVVAAWRTNRRVIEAAARAWGVRTLFVWQPVPCFEYDLKYHLFFGEWAASRLRPERMRRGYELVDRERVRDGVDDGFLWLADLQKDLRQNLYVDEIHYGPWLSDTIAARIARHLAERGWLDRPARPATSAPAESAG